MATDFFQQQDAARRKSVWLVILFCAAVCAIVSVIYLMVALVFANVPNEQAAEHSGDIAGRLWNAELFVFVSLGTLAVISLGSLYKIAELSAGGEKVALMLGGRRIDPNTRDLAERRLLNVVEEMALASGMPVPPVFVLDEERSINAFAAGHTPGDAVVAVSRGALDYLTRDELQGVMGHEFSHILNGDMRLNLRLIGLLHGILLLAILGYYLMRLSAYAPSSRRSKNEGGMQAALLLAGLALLVIGYVGVFFGKLIKAGVSRQREYLADASAVQFTRYPDGIAGALKKIGALTEGSRIRDPHAEECSHLFFCDALSGTMMNLFSTHPPLVARIKRLDPDFDGTFPPIVPPAVAESDASGQERRRQGVARPALRFVARTAPQDGEKPPRRGSGALLHATNLPNLVGMGAVQIGQAAVILDHVPQPMRNAARDPFSARAVIYALLLSSDSAVRAVQLNELKSLTEPLCYQQTVDLASLADRLPVEVRLPLADMSLPALKQLSPRQYEAFRDAVQALTGADRRIDLFEYMIQGAVLRYLDLHFGRSKPPAIRYASLSPLAKPLSVVLSLLARVGNRDQAAAERAFGQAREALGRPLEMLEPTSCTLANLDAALKELARATPPIKKRIVIAAAACVTSDGKVTPQEWELLRSISAMLDCPMPPGFATEGAVPAVGSDGLPNA
ncbi:MAG: M48 family metallopeptidase [Thermogutta sp.]|nr:M48 family metallopeptidase [Thermogutta sp.]